MLTWLSLSVFLGSAAACIVFLHAFRPVIEQPVLGRTNFLGEEIPGSVGFLFPLSYLLVYLLVVVFERERPLVWIGPRESLLLLILGMCLIGLLDDVLGSEGTRGFKGHMKEALRGRLTTGFLKALGGFLIAAAASAPFSRHIWDLFLNGALIALCANLFNLLDVRPGRALKVFFPLLVGVIALDWGLGDTLIPYLLSVGAVAVVLLPGDLSRRFMLGDSGSNVMGATVGLGIAIGAGPWWRFGVTVLLACLNLLSEKYSFSRAISSNRVLNWLDSLGRKGERISGTNYNK
jgi:UDP-GlcNAc:undecaprenyl-phosphate GlcNAc-1-phosphate transferase